VCECINLARLPQAHSLVCHRMLACSKETPLEARQVHNRSLFRQCTRNMVSTLCSSAQTWCSTCFARIVSMQALLQTQITRSRALNGKACLAAMNEQRQARSDEAVSSPLLQLPDLVVAKLVKHLKHRKGSPLLAVCSSLRDAVVSGLQRIRFAFAQHETQETAAANARLLSRVCSSSRPGLKVYLDTTWRHQDGEELLSILLQPGISLGGWSNVTHLEVGSASLHALHCIAARNGLYPSAVVSCCRSSPADTASSPWTSSLLPSQH
jgi:hypothetical protein